MGPQRQKPRASFFCSFLWYMGLARFCSGAVTWREGSIWWMKGGRGKAQELRITPASFRMGVSTAPYPPLPPPPTTGILLPCQPRCRSRTQVSLWGNIGCGTWRIWKEKSGTFYSETVGSEKVSFWSPQREFPLCETFQASPGVQRLQELAHYGQSRGLLLLPCIRRWWGIPVLFHQNIY